MAPGFPYAYTPGCSNLSSKVLAQELELALFLDRQLLYPVSDLHAAFASFLQSSPSVSHSKSCIDRRPRLQPPRRESKEGTWLPANRRRCFIRLQQLACHCSSSRRHHCNRGHSLWLLASSNRSRGWYVTRRYFRRLSSRLAILILSVGTSCTILWFGNPQDAWMASSLKSLSRLWRLSGAIRRWTRVF